MARAIVIGGEGFIGRHLVAALVARGDEVIVAGRPNRAGRLPLPGATTLRLDLADRAGLHALFARHPSATVFHLAAQTRRRACDDLSDAADSVASDLDPLLHVVAAAAAAASPPVAFLRAGSIAEYGFSDALSREDGAARPFTTYGAALLAGTAYLGALAPRLPFPTVTARLALAYGPGQSPDFLAARLMHDLPRRRPVTVARPEDRRALIHVEDAVRGLIAAAERPVPIVNISTEGAPTMRQLAQTVLVLAGANPGLVRFGRQDDVPHVLACDTALAREALGFEARIDLRTGIAMTLRTETPTLLPS
ncbi:UDP-glucose 4-epimerase [Palleronia marisminoris]|uniref:dTDP-4-dehydro-6-deoxyglucose reductase n=1 Tax=Palleronia marisminoris TaxID=315423 RepID=A0A1Y5SCM0_9RHOB|nr:NAD(P)-dependent oxidoreductase [Palleronia marisminoris]SFG67927.1 UDP-glucose 4-epimerase [Palleronia marisminoris]SLN34552.1 dTDP-4-dehydro-6-deoxyglucose reductase [Palleronia marisminoris]